jgi:predicted Zn-dependent peptidase
MTVRISTLPQGLRVVTDSMETVETVTLGVWVEAGTRHETPEVNGVAHMLEHMAFKGTEKRSARAIAEEIEAVGGHLNAYTSREHTAYYAKVLKEDTGLALDILSDILQHSTFDPEELAREQAVVVQEIAQAEDTPDDIIFDHFQATAFPGQGIGRPVLGTEKIVRSLNRDAVRGYMREHYGAPRMVFSAAGKLDHERILDMASKAFGDLPPHKPAKIDPASYKGGDFREERDLEQLHLVLGFAGVPFDDADYYPASVLATVLGGGMSSRLFQEVREKRGLAYSVYAYASSYADGGLFSVYAGTAPGEASQLIPVLCEEIVKATGEIGEDEIMRARAQLKSSILMSLESTSARCEMLARQMQVFGRPLPPAEVVAKIEAVDLAALSKAAKLVLSSKPTVAAMGPLAGVEEYDRIAARLKI